VSSYNERQQELAEGGFFFSRCHQEVAVGVTSQGIDVNLVRDGEGVDRPLTRDELVDLALALATELYHERLIRGAFAPRYRVRSRCETTSSYDCNCVGGSSKPYGWHPDLGEVCAKCNSCVKQVPCNRARCLDCNGPLPD